MLSDKALRIAITQIGVQETGNNSGPQVNEYLKSIGLGPGYSWCMAFVYWCFNKASEEMGIKNPLVKTGGVMKHWNTAQPDRRKVHPMPGDIFIMDYGKGLGHTGIVEKVDTNYVYTIEGNTNDDGSRNGDEVCRRKRPRNKIKGYIRYS